MGVAERKLRERAEREGRIVDAARAIAEAEGWPAVTIRRLATEIEYSQPVLYSHFDNREAIVAAVAVEGFRRLTAALDAAVSGSSDRAQASRSAALAYLAFAGANPAVYEAMFALPTGLHFAQPEAQPELSAAFATLADIVAPSADDKDAFTETFWAALHGLAELERAGRIRADAREARVQLLVQGLIGG